MLSAHSTLSSVQKPKRNYFDEFLPLYKKFGESNEKHEHTKKPAKSNKKLKKNTSAIEQSTTIEVNDSFSTSKSQKRSKSVNFLLEEKDQAIAKKIKSDGSQDGATGDKLKEKKHKKNKKSEKENKADDDQKNVDEQAPIVVKNRKLKKQGKWKKQEKTKVAKQAVEKPKKAKKQKHQEKNEENEGEPASKSPKIEIENLNLGDNNHTLTHLIDEMAVVDKAKQKKLRKIANREKKQQLNQNVTELKQVLNVTNQQKKENVTEKQQNENVTDKNHILNVTDKQQTTEKKKWGAKRWNKQKVAEKTKNTTINVDNLPVSLLGGNFKKVLIDHFSKYGLSRSVGEPIVQNEEDHYPVFSTKMYFNCGKAAEEAQEMDGTIIAGNEIRVSLTRPLTETVLVVRMYGHPDKLSEKVIRDAFGEVGLIRSIKPMLRKKKTMATAFIEFDGPLAVERALQKCANLTINGKQVMASQFKVKNHRNKKKRGGKSKRGNNEAANQNEGADEDSDSDDSDADDDNKSLICWFP